MENLIEKIMFHLHKTLSDKMDILFEVIWSINGVNFVCVTLFSTRY